LIGGARWDGRASERRRSISQLAMTGNTRRSRPPLSRRAVIVGAVPVAAAAIGAVGALAVQLSQKVAAPGRQSGPAAPGTPPPAIANQLPATPFPAVATPAETYAAATPAELQEAAPALRNRGVPEGMVLVASPRLPLAGVGPDDPWALLTGRVTNWSEVGSAVQLPVHPLALAGVMPGGFRAERTLESYEELAAALSADHGAVALVPEEMVDFRVQSLVVGGDDPLDKTVGGQAAVRLGVVGDIVPGRNVHLHMVEYGDFTRPFLRVAPLLRSFDVTVANLEGDLSETLLQPEDPHSVSFVSSPAMLEGFALAGIDAVTLANNHSVWNDEGWGVQGLLDTIAALDGHGIPYFGAGPTQPDARAPWVVDVGGTRIAFLGVDGVTANYEVEPSPATGVLDTDVGATAEGPGTNPYLATQVAEDITAATAIADVVIPYFHLGAEYVAVVPPWAVQAAHAAIDAGAAMVVTNHPHLNQGMEIYAGKPIIYSPGNFILDQMWAAEVRSGYALEIVLRGTAIVGLRFHGVEIEDFHQPRPMTAGEQAALMDRFWAATDRLAAREGTAAQT
jgi:poly-gamma-glutamate capsule biosynthesis protein CapA/YwtB (metallophosphatase superfamily)